MYDDWGSEGEAKRAMESEDRRLADLMRRELDETPLTSELMYEHSPGGWTQIGDEIYLHALGLEIRLHTLGDLRTAIRLTGRG